MIKYIFVTGGVVSGLGKGITAASIGMMLKAKGLNIIAQKLDPYINMDPGNMNPTQHGEVYVTEDGAETDLDLGHYERFIDVNLNKYSNITTGKVYWNVLENERKGMYSGETVQVIPHITNEIKKFIYSVSKKTNADVVITEIGGTTGDIESLPYIEAIRQVANEVGRENCLFIHVTLAPVIKSTGEMKSKPTQHSVKELRSLGISPNIIVLRCDRAIDEETRAKISMFCNVEPDCVIENTDVSLLYDVPMMLEKSNFTSIVSRELGLSSVEPDLTEWKQMLVKAHNRNTTVCIGLIGHYVKMYDAYISIAEALTHAGIENGANIEIKWIEADKVNTLTAQEILSECNGVLVAGGIGEKGVGGMIYAIEYLRKNNIPFLGIDLGMHAAVIEFAQNVANIEDADSKEFNPNSQNKVIDLADDGSRNTSMKLGAYEFQIAKGTALYNCYKKDSTFERFRNRYQFNNKYRESFKKLGLIASAISKEDDSVEALELKTNKFHVAVQFNPQFKSRPHKPHPIFLGFIAASQKNIKK